MTVRIDTGCSPVRPEGGVGPRHARGVRVDAAATGLVVPVPDDASRP